MSHFVAYILYYREVIVAKIPLGWGWGQGHKPSQGLLPQKELGTVPSERLFNKLTHLFILSLAVNSMHIKCE